MGTLPWHPNSLEDNTTCRAQEHNPKVQEDVT
jgi:hypothetical protein